MQIGRMEADDKEVMTILDDGDLKFTMMEVGWEEIEPKMRRKKWNMQSREAA